MPWFVEYLSDKPALRSVSYLGTWYRTARTVLALAEG